MTPTRLLWQADQVRYCIKERRYIMKRSLTRLFIFSTLLLFAGWTWAAAAPLVVTHTVIGSGADSPATAIDICVHVANPGDTALSDVTLSFVSLPQLNTRYRTLNLGNLAPHQSVDFFLHLKGQGTLDGEKIAQRTLLFAGKCIDASGAPVEFRVTSNPGGAE
jgi:hypothetical protein